MRVCPINNNNAAFQGKIQVYIYKGGGLISKLGITTTSKNDELIKRTVLRNTDEQSYTIMWKNKKTDEIHNLIESIIGKSIPNKEAEKSIYVDRFDQHIIFEDRTAAMLGDGVTISINFPHAEA